AGDTVVLATGESITLNEDGTLSITADGDLGTITFEYSASYGMGNAKPPKAGSITLNTVPGVVAGTMIRTGRGDVPVERLHIGDMVLTRDDELQPIRWIGQRTLPAEGKMAPVRIARGKFGDHQTLMVSPLHRVLVRNVHADLLFGSSEVLIAARDLIDGRDVRQVEGGLVHYVHLLFDHHQVVWSEGLETESFLPGPQTTHCFEEETVAEIREIFPNLDPATGSGYGPSARPALKSFEARLLAG
ncbi:MAG: Hint domain-containing protein, partial [Boseongicola sp.]